MNTIPSNIIIGADELSKLDGFYESGKDDDDISELRIEFTKFLKKAYLTMEGDWEVSTAKIESSFFLRLILDKYSQQGSKTRKISNFRELKIDPWNHNILHHLDLSQLGPIDSKPIISISELPKDWRKLSNHKKTIYKVGGSRPDFSGWKGILLQKIPIKNLLLVDPYYLENLDLASLNLVKMFEGLLESKRFHEITLSIIVRYDPSVREFEAKKKSDLEHIKGVLESKFPKLVINISIFYVKKRLTHDRYLFSDFYYLSCQGGFRFYDLNEVMNSQKSMDLNVYYLSSFQVAKAYYSRIDEIYGWLKSSRSLFASIGSGENDLFSIVNRI